MLISVWDTGIRRRFGGRGLDRILGTVFEQQIAGKLAGYEDELRQGIEAKTQGPIDSLGGLTGELDGYSQQQDAIGDQLSALLESIRL